MNRDDPEEQTTRTAQSEDEDPEYDPLPWQVGTDSDTEETADDAVDEEDGRG